MPRPTHPYLKSPIRGSFYYLYMIVDIWSRKIVGFAVHHEQSAEHAADLITDSCAAESVQRDELILHSDNGGPMKGATMLVTLQDLGIVPSFSRPRVSDDNPISEALFRTLKYRTDFPSEAFSSIEDAREWVVSFVTWYNTIHLHSSIQFLTPEQRHNLMGEEVLRKREKVYEAAQAANPSRWSGSTRNWKPVEEVVLNPSEERKELQSV